MFNLFRKPTPRETALEKRDDVLRALVDARVTAERCRVDLTTADEQVKILEFLAERIGSDLRTPAFAPPAAPAPTQVDLRGRQ